MGEIKTPLCKLGEGATYGPVKEGPVYVIEDKHSHNDILRFVAEDQGNSGLMMLAETVALDGTTAKERVEYELVALKVRAQGLMDFIEGGKPFQSLPDNMKGLLNAQLLAMHAYMSILQQRLDIWDS